MGLFGSLFGSNKKSSSRLPPEIKEMFDKLARFMEDEAGQNSVLHPMMRDRVINGLDVDMLPNAIGDFGRSSESPIPVNGAIGELIYLSRLMTKDAKQGLLFHRLGSVEYIDIYETVSIDARRWDILFLSMYHPRKSRKAPAGYLIVDQGIRPLIFGTNRRVSEFPHRLQEAIAATTEEFIGISLPPPEVRMAVERLQFRRPQDHEKRVQMALEHLDGFRE
jgi:hypothetical protein